MIVHMLENADVTVGDLVEAVRKVESIQEQCRIQHQDTSRYPSSTSTSYHKPAFNKDKNKNRDKDKKDDKGNGKGTIKVKAAQLELESKSNCDASEDSDAERSADKNALWRD